MPSRKRRLRDLSSEVGEFLDKKADKVRLESKKDEELFEIDRGTKVSRKDGGTQEEPANRVSLTDKKLMAKYERERLELEKLKSMGGGKVVQERILGLEMAMEKRKKAILRTERKSEDVEELRSFVAKEEPSYDVWGSAGEVESEKRTSWKAPIGVVDAVRPKLHLRRSKVGPRTLVPGQVRVEAAPAPHPGSSYNPVRRQHEDIVGEGGTAEYARMSREKRNQAFFAKKDPAKYALELDGGKWSALFRSQGRTELLGESDDEEDVVEQDEDGEMVGVDKETYVKPKTPRKTRQQRRRQRILEKEKGARLRAKQKRIMLHEVGIAPSLVRKIESEEKARKEEKQRIKREKRERLQQKGNVPYDGSKRAAVDPDLWLATEAPLTEDFRGSLRSTKMASTRVHPATERLRILQQQDKVEYKTSKYTKKQRKPRYKKIYTN